MGKKILLIDGFSILNRAFYALPLLSTRDGEYTNAVYGFMNIFFRFLDEEKPDFVTVAFDLPQPTFRHEIYGAYKGTRKGMPDELRAQVPTLKKLLEIMEINIAESPGYEADDVIGTLSKKAVENDLMPVIISGDRDLLQLTTDIVKVRLPKTRAGKTEVEDYYANDVFTKYGVSPSAFIDLKALMGDTSDNVPGVPGIGEVTATKIITAYGSLDNAFANVKDIKPKKASENLALYIDQAKLSRTLVTIVTDAPVELCLHSPDNMWNAVAQEEIKRLELKTLYKRFQSKDIKDPIAVREINTVIIKTLDEAKKFFENLIDKNAAASFLWNKHDAGQELVGIAIQSSPDSTTIPYITVETEELSLFSSPGMSSLDLLESARAWLESDTPKCVYDYKANARFLHDFGITINGEIFDTMLAAYVIDPLAKNSNPADIASIYLNETLATIDDILDNKGKRGKDRRTIWNVPQDVLAKQVASVADMLMRVKDTLISKLQQNNQLELYHNIEMPTAKALLSMETFGMRVDKDILLSYGDKLTHQLDMLTAMIYSLAGEEFNINSPAQVGVVLFEKLGLKGGKKTTQGYSTAADVLEKLYDKHDIVPLILEYRAHAKLKSTYVDGLIPLINPSTNRIYSTFNQASTATGRLSSAEPNLQNIPIRMPLGRELRKAFLPSEGFSFVSADYSQIELRLLAHISGDETLINAFNNDMDIHSLTASQVLGIPAEDVTLEQRSRAKAVNFGIIYGMSAFGLSEDLKISVKEAEAYIAAYFRQYPGVKKYLDKTISDAKINGYVSTICNRRRMMMELKSPNFNTRAFGERVAMNMPIQGSAADIIKIAMINVFERLHEKKLTARLILQVHDELLLEVPQNEIETVKQLLKYEMENAISLNIPLSAEVGSGDSWYDTK